jgi:arylsulfatase A-like enzyme
MADPTPDRPNVLLICTDHWSGLLNREAGHPVVMTPTLSQLSRFGVTYSQAYSACPSCIPARRSLMTGLRARSHGDRTFKEWSPMPDAPTMAQCFRDAGYQAYAVGKFHVYPQRDRVGFDDVILEEQGRHQFDGRADDYELYLAEQGHTGMEYATGMCHNDFIARPWHLPEHCHPINWAVREMSRTIHRRNTEKPGFWYLSFSAPHPPLTPLKEYLDLYRDVEIDRPTEGNWSSDPDALPYALQYRNNGLSALIGAPWHEQALARRAFYATLTHIDHQIRLLIGLLREQNMLDNTLILFTSDHGHMIGEHGLWCMTPLYEMSAKIPLIICPPQGDTRLPVGTVDDRIAEFGDIMPTLLDLCGIPLPDTVEGQSLAGEERRDYLYGEHFEDELGMRMIRSGRFKLIYYATGNRLQLFDIDNDPRETTDLAGDGQYADELARLKSLLVQNLYGTDEAWIRDGKLVGLPEKRIFPGEKRSMIDQRGLMNQRGLRFL